MSFACYTAASAKVCYIYIYPLFLMAKVYLLNMTFQVENLKLLSLSHNFPLLYGTWLAKILTIGRWEFGADLKQYLCAAS